MPAAAAARRWAAAASGGSRARPQARAARRENGAAQRGRSAAAGLHFPAASALAGAGIPAGLHFPAGTAPRPFMQENGGGAAVRAGIRSPRRGGGAVSSERPARRAALWRGGSVWRRVPAAPAPPAPHRRARWLPSAGPAATPAAWCASPTENSAKCPPRGPGGTREGGHGPPARDGAARGPAAW